MIFLLTYATINLVVAVEQSLGLVSFRPTFRIPKIVPFIGLAGFLVAMFIINPIFSLLATAVVATIYFFLLTRKLTAPTGDVRSGLFTALAEWAAKQVEFVQSSAERAWKPNILLPVEDPSRLGGDFELVQHVVYPMGLIKLLGIAPPGKIIELQERFVDTIHAFMSEGVCSSSTVMEGQLCTLA